MSYYINVFKNYTNFAGRARRREYWMYTLFTLVAGLILLIIDGMIGINLFTGLYSLVAVIPTLALGFRRLHDIGRSGAWLLISIVPLIGAIILFVFFCTDSEPGANQYGDNPKE